MSQEEFSEYAQSDTEEYQSEHDKKHQSKYDEDENQSEHNKDNGNSTLTPGMCLYYDSF
jgi:hypothetical protein